MVYMGKFKVGDNVRIIEKLSFLLDDIKYDKIIIVEINSYTDWPIKCEFLFRGEITNRMNFKEGELQKFSPFTRIRALVER